MAKKSENKAASAKAEAPEASVPKALLDRLDRIESALMTLIEVVKTAGIHTSPAAASAPQARPVAGPGEPPLIQVAPPARPIKVSAPPVAPTPVAKKAAAPKPAPAPELPEIEVPGKDGSVDDVLKRVFEAITLPVAEHTWAVLTRLTHSGQLVGPRSVEHYKAFSWHKARRTGPVYLVDNNPASYSISHMQPATIEATTDRVKIFLKKSDGSLPAPIVLARDPDDDNAWRIAQMSL